MNDSKRKILFLCSFLMLFDSCINSQNLHYRSNWINTDYVNCLANKLPCECEKEIGSYFVIKLDTIYLSILLLKYGDLEEEQFDLKKVSENVYDAITINEVNNKCIGRISIIGKRLYYIDDQNEKLVFDYFGVSQTGNTVENSKLNIELLNKAFLNRGYYTLEKMLNDSMLNCRCNNTLGSINFISSEVTNRHWIIEQGTDSIFIYKVVNPLEIDVPIKKEILNKYKW
jgi:hypothetical protein